MWYVVFNRRGSERTELGTSAQKNVQGKDVGLQERGRTRNRHFKSNRETNELLLWSLNEKAKGNRHSR